MGDRVREIGGATAEQREGGRGLLDALARLRDISKEIDRGAGEMAAGNASILAQVERLRGASEQVARNTDEITQGTKEINDAVMQTIELSSRNAELIGEVKASVERFQT